MQKLAYILLLLVFFSDTYSATQPKFLIIPTKDINITLNKTSEAIVQYRVTNQTSLTRQLTMVYISGIKQEVDGDNYCANPFTLSQGQSCLLTLKVNGSELNVGTTNVAVQVCKTQINQNTPDPFLCSKTSSSNNLNITVLSPPRLSVTPRSLKLTAGGPSEELFVTNLSSTEIATNVQAYLDRTSLYGNVTLNEESCKYVAPGKTCSIIFTPGTTTISQAFFRIQGVNTFPTSASASVSSDTSAQITVSGSPLVLTTDGSSGTLAVNNLSSTITANNVAAQLTAEVAASVTQDASNCASLAPLSSCNLVFTPKSTALSPTTVNISGSNTSLTSAQISVNSPSKADLIITSTLPLVLKANGSTTGTITIFNNSTSITAENIVANFSGTDLIGAVTATPCASVAPKTSCTMTFTPGINTVLPTSFQINGSNTTTVIGQLAISSYYIYITNTGSGDGIGSIVRCNVSPSDGELTGCTTVMSNVLYRPAGITFNEAGTYAYIVKATPAAVMSCQVSPSGAISSSSCKTITLDASGSTSANGVVYNSQFNFIQVTLSTNTVYTCSLDSSGSITSCTHDSSVSNLSSPIGIALNPSISIAYIANYSDSSIISCEVSSVDGSLSSCAQSVGLGSYLVGVVINPTNTFAYYTKQTTNAVAWASIGAGGALTYASQLGISGLQNPTGLALNGATNYIYIGNGSGNQVIKCSSDSSTGILSDCNFTGATLLSFPYGVGLYPNPPYGKL